MRDDLWCGGNEPFDIGNGAGVQQKAMDSPSIHTFVKSWLLQFESLDTDKRRRRRRRRTGGWKVGFSEVPEFRCSTECN